MSLFKKPVKKPLQNRRIFTSEVENMEIDEDEAAEAEIKQKKKEKKEKEKLKPQKSSLLSFGDEGIFTFTLTVLRSGDTLKLFIQLLDSRRCLIKCLPTEACLLITLPNFF